MDSTELFDICLSLARHEPSAAATRRLHEVLTLVTAEGCRNEGFAFGNLFSQIDFLSKRLGMDASLAISIQTARRHTNSGAPISSEDWPHDIMAVARLVSAVTATPVPGQLLSQLPVYRQRRAEHLTVNSDYVRCIVSSFTDSTIEADTGGGRVLVDYGCSDGGRDFSYLRRVLREGMQLNLLDCHVENLPVASASAADAVVLPAQRIVPGMVVVEPDFTLDISSLAACFTNYGHHPLIYTVNRLKPRPNSQATLLGNFAGTALDDIIRSVEGEGAEATLASSLQRSFREQALRLLACPDFDAPKFRQQAEVQMQNIREAVALLKEYTAALSPLLEPSFVCERLGLQGRVDMMTPPQLAVQADGRLRPMLLVEQKSGRNHKIERQSHDSHGLQLESHYVQLLLYYGVMRYNFSLSDRLVDMRLLYSRYPAAQGLLSVNYYRTLLREAIKLRNQIVATELLVAREGFGRIAPLLTADYIYNNVSLDEHFHRYVRPEIDSVTLALSLMTPLERAYYDTMMTFVYREQAASKLGSAEGRLHHSAGCASDLWLMPLSEKEETGNIIDGLKLKAVQRGVLTLERRQPSTTSQLSAPNFRTGDMVYLYPYADTPDTRRSILFKGSLLHIDDATLTVELSNEQRSLTGMYAADSRLWAVEHGGSDVGTSSAIRALQAFATADSHRKSLLLGQREPEADVSLRLSRSYSPDYDRVLLGVRQALDYYLLLGPPGTGKTSQALRFIVDEELHCGSHVLLMAYTNRAVDEICAMLARLLPTGGEGSPPSFLRLGKPSSCDARFHPFLLDTVLASTRHLDDARTLLAVTPVIVGTTATLQAQSFLLSVKSFDLAIVDEASQILEPAVIGLLASSSIRRFVLVGDHKQLPAVVQQEARQSLVHDERLKAIALEDCRQSLFERLLRWEHRQHRTQFVGVLHSHGRMHPAVAHFPLTHFYLREQLRAVPLPHQQEDRLHYPVPPADDLDRLLTSQRLLFLPTQPEQGDTEEQEAILVAGVIGRIHRLMGTAFSPQHTVGVIVPYRRQITLISQVLAQRHSQVPQGITIDTVERFQGSQRDVIIYSFAVSHAYQLGFITATSFTDDDGTLVDRKLNVALTRARRQNIIVGRRDIISRVPLFKQLIDESNYS